VAAKPLVALVPVVPATSGAGTAMRAANVVRAAGAHRRVLVAVVPVAARSPGSDALAGEPLGVLEVGDRRAAASGVAQLLADPVWRTRLAAAAPLPWLARDASPGLVAGLEKLVVSAAPEARGAPVHVMRSYLAPLGLALAERLGSPWATLDLDDDDEAFFRGEGEAEEADAFGRVVSTFAPEYSRVAAAAPGDAAELGRRHGLDVAVVPNSVVAPTQVRRAPAAAPALLFVGSLGYEPNAEAARTLAEQVLPLVRAHGDPRAEAWIVGNYSRDNEVARLGALPGVVLFGFVEDVGPLYARAAVVVAPLASGSGTKLKVLEAFAHGAPVVTTPVGAAGLGGRDGVHLLVGEGPGGLARHVCALLADRELADRLSVAARAYVLEHHGADAVERAVGELFSAAAAAPLGRMAHGRRVTP
jgi:glycosyltransferase involved in cell wall biosynthesis